MFTEEFVRRKALFIVAAPGEAQAAARALERDAARAPAPWRTIELSERVDLLVTGVGKANAAGALARRLTLDTYALAVNFGLCGALPESGLRVTDCVLASNSVYADEGVLTETEWIDVAAMGFPPEGDDGVGVAPDAALSAAIRPIADAFAPIATVSSCSGTDEAAREVVTRTGAAAEAMEGAALGFTLKRLARAGAPETPFAEARVVSNTTGDRAQQTWRLDHALDKLAHAIERVHAAIL